MSRPSTLYQKRKHTAEGSDDEGAPACSVARLDACAGALSDDLSTISAAVSKVECDLLNELQDTHRRVAVSERRLAEIHRQMTDGMISLNVGGATFDVPRATLLSVPDSLFHAMLDPTASFMLDRDRDGRVLIDRDPHTFRHVLNYLRGYHRFFHVCAEEIAMLLCDADYYQLPLLRELLAPPTQPVSGFEPGPGVNADRNRFRVQYGVGIVGDKPIITGRHSIIFEVLDDHYLGIGAVSDACTATDQEFHKVANCCVYYMTGVFYSNFPHFRKEENLERFETGDIVKVTLDMDDRTLEFEIRGKPPKVVFCATATSLRFAVAMKLQASVRILDQMPPERPPRAASRPPAAGPVVAVNSSGLMQHDAETLLYHADLSTS